MENNNQNLATLEAILFAYGEPIEKKKIAKLLNLSKEEVDNLVNELEKECLDLKRGLNLIILNERVQLITKNSFGEILRSLLKEELSENLTPASLETLSLIFYFEPISRAKINYLRGVNSAFILRNLLIRGLIEKIPDPNNSQSSIYFPSFEAKKYLGVNKKEDLPEFEKFQELLKKFETNQEMISGNQI